MGVSSLVNRVDYNGDGTTTSFSFPYYFFKQTDLLVYIYDTLAGGIVLQTLNNQYSITGTQNAQGLYPSGGNVVFNTAPVNTSIIVITRSPPEQQNYALLQNGLINSTALVQQMDYLTLQIQRLQDEVSRCLSIPDGLGSTFNMVLPNTVGIQSASANAYLQVNQNANGITLTGASPEFNLVQVPYTALQAASLTNQVSLFTLPPGAKLSDIFVKTLVPFTGTSITDVVSGIGISTDYNKFINGYDLLASVSDTNFDSVLLGYLGSWANTTNVYLQAVSTGANLSALSTGLVNIYYSYTML